MKYSFAYRIGAAALTFGFVCSVSSAASYRYSMNAMCYLKDKADASVEPFNPTEKEVSESGSSYVRKVPTKVTEDDVNKKFRIASLSKILVTHWAIHDLGPTYRFTSKVHVSPSENKNACTLHFSGDHDPFLGKEMLGTVFSQLKTIFKNKKVCATIDKITYDENFIVPFNDVTKSFVIQHRKDFDLRASNPARFIGPNTTRRALQYFAKRQKDLKVKSDNIESLSAADYAQRTDQPTVSYSFQSRPLYMMLREFNAYSFNVPPDILFKKLGGEPAYAQFIKKRLGYDFSQVDVANGSGYPIISDGKRYNEVSCGAVVRVIQDLDNLLAAYKGGRTFHLADVMAVGGTGEVYSTFKSLYGSSRYTNALVAKTGSAEEAITFGGMLSTEEGELYFAVLTRPEAYTSRITNSARYYIRDLMSILSERHELKKFDYKQIGLMIPYDSSSKLVEIKVEKPKESHPELKPVETTTPEVKTSETKASETKAADDKASEAKAPEKGAADEKEAS